MGRRLLDEFRGQGCAQPAIDHDAQRRRIAKAGQAHAELGIIRQHRATANHDGIIAAAQQMAELPGAVRR